jgi:DNA repair exonuclease SbcCD ATPase subunit
MRNLIINRIKYTIETDAEKKYGADVSFQTGLNIIYGPNSVGKSSLITGILYCLGSEKALGIFQNKQNPFKPEFYDKIHNEKIIKSFVMLEISNGKEIITLIRSIIKKTDVAGMKNVSIDSFSTTAKIKYLIASGDGVFSPDGLQSFLFNFLNWEIVNVPTYEGTFSKIYLENLIPLFFVEQRAGWSQIQARQVMRYGIREVKKVAFEYVMGLNRFDIHIKEIERKELSERIQRLKRDIKEKEENILIVVNGSIEKDVLYVTRPATGKVTIENTIKQLRLRYEEGQKEIGSLSKMTENADTQENSLRKNLRITSHQTRKALEKISLLQQEIAGYENYIDRININKNKNKQLKKIEGLAPELNISNCPVCETPLSVYSEGECKLCRNELTRKISTPDENLEFLEDERSSFEKILETKRLELKKTRQRWEDLKQREQTITENIDHQISTYVGPQLDKYRQKISELDLIFKDIELFKRVVERWENLKPLRRELVQFEKDELKLKETIAEYHESESDKNILRTLVSMFRENVRQLRLLKGKDELINVIKIDDTDFYTPYLEEYDLYNISSSSDNVRVILSYYLSMLQTSIQLDNPKIKFPNLLILDEPKQQNLDDKDLNTFIEILENLPTDSCQVILTTFSEQERNKDLFGRFIRYEMKDV